jgi:transposase
MSQMNGTQEVEPQSTVPDPEVVERPTRRKFTAEDKQRILRDADHCKSPGDVGALLRREGLYRSHLYKWREQRDMATRQAFSPQKQGRKPQQRDPLAYRVTELERENARLQQRLKQAEAVIEIQKKIAEILSIPLNPPEKERSS